MAVISEIKVQKRKTRLPEEYQEVEYLESTGTQYIDTGVKCQNNIGCSVEFAFNNNSTTYQYLLGEVTVGTSRFSPIFLDKENNSGFFSYTATLSFSFNTYGAFDTNKHKVDFNSDGKRNVIYDGIQKGVIGETATGLGKNIYIFGRNNSSLISDRVYAKIYSLKLYDNGIIVRNFVPCYEKSTKIAGLYDLVNGVFYKNKGTGFFSVGSAIDPVITKYNRETIKEIIHDGNVIPELPAGEYHFAKQNEFIVLPEEYQMVEYIKSESGLPFIDTGVVGDSTQRVVCDVFLPNVREFNAYAFGSRVAYKDRAIYMGQLINTANPGIIAGYYNLDPKIKAAFGKDERCIMEQNRNMFYINGELLYIGTETSFTTNSTIYLFGVNQQGTLISANNTGLAIYSCKIYKNNILVRDFVPCYRKKDNEIGMYDLVEDKFYINLGNGTFSTGQEVEFLENAVNEPIVDMQIGGNSELSRLPDEYQEIEYLESTGTQYIDTLMKPNNHYLEIGFQYTRTDLQYQSLFGCWNALGQAGYYMLLNNNVGTLQWGYQCGTGQIYTQNLMKDILEYKVIKFNYQNKIYINDEEFATVESSKLNLNWNLVLFGGNTNNNPKGSASVKIYYCKITDNLTGQIVRNFVPARNRATGEAGLYDLVDSVFYTNSGTGIFAIGEVATPTPTPEAPIKIMSVGDYDEATGKYKIPVTINNSVPSEYQEVEYISTTGSAYINTGILPKSTFTYETSIKTPAVGGRFWGSYDGVMIGSLGTKWRLGAHLAWFDGWDWGEIDRNIFTKFRFDSTGVYINGTFYEHTGFTMVNNNGWAIYLLAVNYQNAPNQNQRNAMEYTRIYDNGELAYNFIPCYRKADGEIGLYETVNGVFYTNSGTGEFVVGAEVNVTNIYLNEPLRAIYDNYDNILYADYIDYKNRKVVRNTTKFTLDGSQYIYTNATVIEGYQTYHMLNSLYGLKGGTPVYSDKLIGNENWDFAQTTAREQLSSATAVLTIRIADSRGVEFSTAGIQQWLADNPIEVIHALATPTEETIDIPEISTFDGTNTFGIETTVNPSEIKINYWKQI